MQAARSQQGAAARTGLDEELQPTQLLHVPQDAMLAILDETPRGWHALAMLLTCRTRHAFDEIEASALLPAGGRVARKLLALAGGYGNHALMHRTVRVPQQQLAAMLALSRQTVNRSLEQLEAQGTIRLTRGGTELIDLDRLREIAQ
jgi:CRP-like cAMP-binding protein